ncbi:MAG: hypothetical protein IEMM0008_1702 [bacterium]|nr:MAG: hypothetical protein IEMM0008_1702 [bacterium]
MFGDDYEPVEKDEDDNYYLNNLGIYITHDPDKRLRLLDSEKNFVLYRDERIDRERYRADRESYRAEEEANNVNWRRKESEN